MKRDKNLENYERYLKKRATIQKEMSDFAGRLNKKFDQAYYLKGLAKIYEDFPEVGGGRSHEATEDIEYVERVLCLANMVESVSISKGIKLNPNDEAGNPVGILKKFLAQYKDEEAKNREQSAEESENATKWPPESTENKTNDPAVETIHHKAIAYYTLFTAARRLKDYGEMSQFVRNYEDMMKGSNKTDVSREKQLLLVLQLYETSILNEEGGKGGRKLKSALEQWEAVDKGYQMIPAFIQIYADTVVFYGNYLERNGKSIESEAGNIVRDALEKLEAAISYRPYPKFYSSSARLHYLREEYDEAIEEIRKAIEIEDSTRKDYSIRIADYEIIKAKSEIDIEKRKMLKEVRSLRDEVKASKFDQLTTLGFFASILALIIGGTQLAANGDMDLEGRLKLIFAFGGVIGLLVGAFGAVAGEPKKWKKSLPLIIIGIALIVGIRFVYLFI